MAVAVAERLPFQPACGLSHIGKRGCVPSEIGEERLWQDWFVNPRQWWGNRAETPSPRHPDSRHKGISQLLWLSSRVKPGWVDLRLARWDAGAGDGERETMVERLSRRCEDGELGEAVEALDVLAQRGCRVHDSVLYRLLKRCSGEKGLELGRRVHSIVARQGWHKSNAFVATHIMGMYAAHGKLEDAVQVFGEVEVPNAHMWCCIILAHARHGQPREAIAWYRRMKELSVEPDNHIFMAVLKACASATDLVAGKEVHVDMLGSGVRCNSFVGSSLVNMYAKCGSLEDARRVFDRLESRNLVTWTAMLAAYAQHGRGQEALDMYACMQGEGLAPTDTVTFVCLLQACGSVAALQQGKELHKLIRQIGLEVDVVVGNALVDMYAKCASLEEARGVFDRMPVKSLVTWNALLSGYAENGDMERARQCFGEMLQEGVEPDGSTFISLIVACSHAGLVDEGRQFFRMMKAHGIEPTDHHYNCLVDLLGRAGRLDEAEQVLHTMPLQDNVVGWTSLLSACKTHKDADRGRRCFDRIVKMVPEKASAYILLGNIYAKAGRWEDVEQTESLRRAARAWKKPARACIEVKNKVHEFTVGEEKSDISSGMLSSVSTRLVDEGGRFPRTQLGLKPRREREKEDAVCGHAERVAIAFGLLNTPDGTTLLVTKNLRMCNYCHSSIKIMSRLEKREIIVRDANRVHRFSCGSCSCKDRQ